MRTLLLIALLLANAMADLQASPDCDSLWLLRPPADFSKLVLSPDSKYIATASSDIMAVLISTESGNSLGTFEAGGVPKFNMQSDALYTLDAVDSTITVYSIPKLEAIRKFTLPIKSTQGIIISYNYNATKCLVLSNHIDDGSGVSTTGKPGYAMMNLRNGNVEKYVFSDQINRLAYLINDVSFVDSTDNIVLVESFREGSDTLRRTSIVTPNLLDTLFRFPQLMYFHDMSEDGAISLFYRYDQHIEFFRAGNYSHGISIGTSYYPEGLAINSKNNILAFNHIEKNVELYSLANGSKIGVLDCSLLKGFQDILIENDKSFIGGLNGGVVTKIGPPSLLSTGMTMIPTLCSPDPVDNVLTLHSLPFDQSYVSQVYVLQSGGLISPVQYMVFELNGVYAMDTSMLVTGAYSVIISNRYGSESCSFVKQ